MINPSLDVIIATYNRQVRLIATLESLQRQSISGFGVIVVDDGSSPRAEAVVPPELSESLGVQWLETGGNMGPANARNLGAAASSADLIAFIDDDVDGDRSWLDAHLARQAETVGNTVTIGPLLAPRDWKPTAWNRWEAAKLAREYERMERGEYEPTWRQFFTGNAMLPRALFEAAGGFDANLRRAEDIELGLRLARLGASFVFEPRAKGWHYAHRSCEAWLSNAEQYARVDLWLDRAHPELGWRALIDDELSARAPASHAIRRSSTVLLGQRVTVRMAVGLARLLNRAQTHRWAVRAASLAYDVRYRTALASAEREQSPALAEAR